MSGAVARCASARFVLSEQLRALTRAIFLCYSAPTEAKHSLDSAVFTITQRCVVAVVHPSPSTEHFQARGRLLETWFEKKGTANHEGDVKLA